MTLLFTYIVMLCYNFISDTETVLADAVDKGECFFVWAVSTIVVKKLWTRAEPTGYRTHCRCADKTTC